MVSYGSQLYLRREDAPGAAVLGRHSLLSVDVVARLHAHLKFGVEDTARKGSPRQLAGSGLVIATVMQVDTVDPLETFVTGIREAPWGMLSRSQTDYLIFRLLADSRRINVSSSDFELANELRTTVSRIRALRFRYEQDQVREHPRRLTTMLTEENFSFEHASEGRLRVSIRSRFLREFFAAKLAARGAIAITELTPTTLLVPITAFVETLVHIGADNNWLETEAGQEAHNKLIERLKHLKDTKEADAAIASWVSSTKDVVSVSSGIAEILKAAAEVLHFVH